MQRILLVLSSALAVALQFEVLAAPPARVKAADIRPERELLITHPAVVDSDFAKYPGPWSFGVLIEQLVGKDAAPQVVREWLEQYATVSSASTTPGFMQIPARPEIRSKVIEPWQRRDGFDPAKGEPWSPKLANAPFRLLAIVNRMDLVAPELVDVQTPIKNAWRLRGKEEEFTRMLQLTGQNDSLGFFSGGGYGGRGVSIEPTKLPPEPNVAGEGRLVFGALGEDGRPLVGGWTIILEYKLESHHAKTLEGTLPGSPARELLSGVRLWAQMWHALGQYELGDHRYNEMLAHVTRAFTHRRGAPDTTTVTSEDEPAFGQLRSSEAAFGKERVFRQFRLAGLKLTPETLPMTPEVKFMEDTPDGGRVLASFLKATEPLILAGLHTLPGNVNDRNGQSHSLLAGHAVIPAGEKEFHWDPRPGISRNARRLFSVNTCNGCHAGDTGCPDGLHIHPRNEGEAARLSAFLRMDGKPNRFQDPGVKSSYVKQEEIADRAAILAALLEPRKSRRVDALEDSLRERLRRGH
jgi:hypothetical protein